MVQNATQRSLPLLLCWWLCIPVLPVMLLQAKGVRKRVPRLPEAAGSRSGESQGDFSDDTFRVAIVGESTAVGVGADTQDEALPGHLARALASRLKKTVRWHVIGGNGMTLKRVVSEVRREHEKRYDAAVVLLGVNDVFRLNVGQSVAREFAAARGEPDRAGGARSLFSPAFPRSADSRLFPSRCAPSWDYARPSSMAIWKRSQATYRAARTAGFAFRRVQQTSRATAFIRRAMGIATGRSSWRPQ